MAHLQKSFGYQSSRYGRCDSKADSGESRAHVEDDDRGEEDCQDHRESEGGDAEQVDELQADRVGQTVLHESGKQESLKLKIFV